MEFITPEQQGRRLAEFARGHLAKSKHKGDYHWRMADQITGLGDHITGADDGEPPKGAE